MQSTYFAHPLLVPRTHLTKKQQILLQLVSGPSSSPVFDMICKLSLCPLDFPIFVCKAMNKIPASKTTFPLAQSRAPSFRRAPAFSGTCSSSLISTGLDADRSLQRQQRAAASSPVGTISSSSFPLLPLVVSSFFQMPSSCTSAPARIVLVCSVSACPFPWILPLTHFAVPPVRSLSLTNDDGSWRRQCGSRRGAVAYLQCSKSPASRQRTGSGPSL